MFRDLQREVTKCTLQTRFEIEPLGSFARGKSEHSDFSQRCKFEIKNVPNSSPAALQVRN